MNMVKCNQCGAVHDIERTTTTPSAGFCPICGLHYSSDRQITRVVKIPNGYYIEHDLMQDVRDRLNRKIEIDGEKALELALAEVGYVKERTCHLEHINGIDTCSECGADIDTFRNYCQSCGARIVG